MPLKDEIHIESFSWGLNQQGTFGKDEPVGGTTVHDAAYEATFRGGITVAVGDVGSGDDVVVDGRIITGEMSGFGDGSVRFVTDTGDLF